VALSRRSRARGHGEKSRKPRGSNVIALLTATRRSLSHYYSCYDTKRWILNKQFLFFIDYERGYILTRENIKIEIPDRVRI